MPHNRERLISIRNQLFKLFALSTIFVSLANTSLAETEPAPAATPITYLADSAVDWRRPNTPNLDLIDYTVPVDTTLSDLLALPVRAERSEFYMGKRWESLYVVSHQRQLPVTIVYIHGLYGGASQFGPIFNKIHSGNSAVNSILLTLPGHHFASNYDLPITSEATKEDWVKAVEETLKIARRLSPKVVVVGQSTGGLLAVMSALRTPELVDGIVLLEPALRVWTDLSITTCLGKHFVRDAHQIEPLANLMGREAPEGVSLKMGCEVSQLSFEVFSAQNEPVRIGDPHPIQKDIFQELAKQIKIPILMVNNVSDRVVSYAANKSFASAAPNAMYAEIGEDGTKHGWTDSLGTVYGKDIFYTEFCNYLAKNFGAEQCYKEFYENKIKPFTMMDHNASDEVAQILIKILRPDEVAQSACEMIHFKGLGESYCESITVALKEITTLWHKLWERYQTKRGEYKTFYEFLTASSESDIHEPGRKVTAVLESFEERMIEVKHYHLEEVQDHLSWRISQFEHSYYLERAPYGPLRQHCERLAQAGWNNVDEDYFQIVIGLVREKIKGGPPIFTASVLLDHCSKISEVPVKYPAYMQGLRYNLAQVKKLMRQEAPDPVALEKLMEFFDRRYDIPFEPFNPEEIEEVFQVLDGLSPRGS